MMSGVNNAKDYYTIMGFGHEGPDGAPVITDSLLQGGIVAVYYLGTLVGALVGGKVGDKYGRIKAIAFGSLWAILGASLQCSAQNHVWMICARLINGWGTGILNAIVPGEQPGTSKMKLQTNVLQSTLPKPLTILLVVNSLPLSSRSTFLVWLSPTGSNTDAPSTRTAIVPSSGASRLHSVRYLCCTTITSLLTQSLQKSSS